MAKQLDLSVYNTQVYFVKNQREFDKIAKKYRLAPMAWLEPGHEGETKFARTRKDGSVAIVSVVKNPSIPLAVILAHEATHVMMDVWEVLGESRPGQEASAYLVDHIVDAGLKFYK